MLLRAVFNRTTTELNPGSHAAPPPQNVASRMESTGTAGVIHVSEDTQRLAAPHMPPGCGRWLRREGVEVKGKGTMDTYWLLPQGHEDAAVAEGSDGMAADGRVWTAAGPAEAE